MLWRAIAGLAVIIALAAIPPKAHRNGQGQQYEKQATEAATPQQPDTKLGDNGTACPGTDHPETPCPAISAAADEEQATSGWANFGAGILTAIVALAAAIFAWRAAIAAESTLQHADATARAQLRAYFTITKEKCVEDEAENTLTVSYIFKNVGLTPAHDLSYRSVASFEPVNEPTPDKRTMEESHVQYGLVPPQDKTRITEIFEMHPEELAAIHKAEGVLRFTTWIRYQDELRDWWEVRHDMIADENFKAGRTLFSQRRSTRRLTADEV